MTPRNLHPRVARLAACFGLALSAVAAPAGAQQSDSTIVVEARTTPAKGGVSTLRVAAGLAVTAVAIAPFDVAITRRLRSSDLQRSTAWRNGATVFDWYGAPGARAVGPLLAIAGSASRNPTLSDIGIHVSESYATAA
ncbi:MAG TPA: hypothetical protein VJT85_06145, partial [Gemmatimonadaceae bacterium]|nr:hypothetical protein [Gemmatimonadaceae bacterium]